MPRDSETALYTRVDNSFSNPVLGTPINPSHADTFFDDVEAAMNAFIGTSTSNVSIGLGSKTLTIQTGKTFLTGLAVRARSQGTPGNYIDGTVTSYNDETGELVLSVYGVGGSGSVNDWIVFTAGGRGSQGPITGFRQTFDSSTTDADPGNGDFRFNNATVASATAMYLDNLDANGGTVSTIIDKWDDSSNLVRGTLWIEKETDPAVWAEFSVTGSVVDGTGYRKLTLSGGSSNGTFTAGDAFRISFIRSGDAGTFLSPDTKVVAGEVTFTLDTTYLNCWTEVDTYNGGSPVGHSIIELPALTDVGEGDVIAIKKSFFTGPATHGGMVVVIPDGSDYLEGSYTNDNWASYPDSRRGWRTENPGDYAIWSKRTADGTARWEVVGSLSELRHAPVQYTHSIGAPGQGVGSPLEIDLPCANGAMFQANTAAGAVAVKFPAGDVVLDSYQQNVTYHQKLTGDANPLHIWSDDAVMDSTALGAACHLLDKSGDSAAIRGDGNAFYTLWHHRAHPSELNCRKLSGSSSLVQTGVVSALATIYWVPNPLGLNGPAGDVTSLPTTHHGSITDDIRFRPVAPGTPPSLATSAHPYGVAASASKTHDLFAYLTPGSGGVVIFRGPSYNIGSARGTGAGTSELDVVDGVRVNKFEITGGSTGNVPAKAARYIGRVETDGSATVAFIYDEYDQCPGAQIISPAGTSSYPGLAVGVRTQGFQSSSTGQVNAVADSTVPWFFTSAGIIMNNTGRLYLIDGSDASPAVLFGLDQNLGIYRVTDDVMAFAANGARVASVETAGWRLGVAGSVQGKVLFDGATSGTITVQGAAAAGTYTKILPTSAGLAGQTLYSSGAGNAEAWGPAPARVQIGLTGIDFNSGNTDNAITVSLPPGYTRFNVVAGRIFGASASLTTATFGLFTAAAGGGTAITAAGTAITVNTASADTNNNSMSFAATNSSTLAYSIASVPTLYFRVGTPQGSAATGSVTLEIIPLS